MSHDYPSEPGPSLSSLEDRMDRLGDRVRQDGHAFAIKQLCIRHLLCASHLSRHCRSTVSKADAPLPGRTHIKVGDDAKQTD